jgi:hypothetical protein
LPNDPIKIRIFFSKQQAKKPNPDPFFHTMTSVKYNVWTKDRTSPNDDNHPGARLGASGVVIGPKLLVFGGARQLDSPFLNDCWAYNMGLFYNY